MIEFKAGEPVFVPHLSSKVLYVYYQWQENGFYVVDFDNPQKINCWFPIDGQMKLGKEAKYPIPLVFKASHSMYKTLDELGFYVNDALYYKHYKCGFVEIENDDRCGYFCPRTTKVPVLYHYLNDEIIECLNIETLNKFKTHHKNLVENI